MNIDALLDRFPRRRQNSPTDWHVPCPAHDDNAEDAAKFSLHVTVTADRILLKCFAGCDNDRVTRKLGITEADLFLRSNGSRAPREEAALPEPTPSLAAFAQLKQLKQSLLEDDGWRNCDGGIAIPYLNRDGSLWRMRYRTSLRPGAGFKWDGQKERALIPYGRHRLDQVMEKGELWLVEGESDAVTAWARGLPCLGIPGNLAGKCLTAEDLVGIVTLWIVREPGQSGLGFTTKLREHLPAIGYAGTARMVMLPAKDLSDLHVLKGREFWPILRQAQTEAVGLFDSAATAAETTAPALFGIGAGTFMAKTFPAIEAYIEGILTSEGSGWIGGEEKLGKSYYAIDEALCLALGLLLCGRFAIPVPRRVLFIEEEDGPRRVHVRLRALVRGHGYDPDDPDVQATLDRQLRLAVWEGVSLDDPQALTTLEATIAAFLPAVVYLDVLRKLTTKDLNKADQAGALLAALDGMRRRHGAPFRILHHYRKQQGFRTGRGSQEIGGSYVLGAWGECSLFFEPIGRKQGSSRVAVQAKDGPAVPGFKLTFYAEGPSEAPTLVRLTAEDEGEDASADDVVVQALATLPMQPALAGRPGVPVDALVTALKKSDKTIRRTLKRLLAAKLIEEAGQMSKQKVLYRVIE